MVLFLLKDLRTLAINSLRIYKSQWISQAKNELADIISKHWIVCAAFGSFSCAPEIWFSLLKLVSLFPPTLQFRLGKVVLGFMSPDRCMIRSSDPTAM